MDTTIGGLSAFAIFLLIFYLCNRKPTQNSSVARRSVTIAIARRDLSVPRRNFSDDSVTIEIGLDEATLNTYPTLLYKEAKVVVVGGDHNSCCSICLDDYCDTDILRVLPNCDHLFHSQCIDPWLKKHITCPICRNSQLRTPSSAPKS